MHPPVTIRARCQCRLDPASCCDPLALSQIWGKAQGHNGSSAVYEIAATGEEPMDATAARYQITDPLGMWALVRHESATTSFGRIRKQDVIVHFALSTPAFIADPATKSMAQISLRNVNEDEHILHVLPLHQGVLLGSNILQCIEPEFGQL